MKKFITTTLFIYLLNSFLFAQISKEGYPFIRNISHKEYNGGPQVWDAKQNSKGIMYFGNVDGIIEYNGAEYNTYRVANKSTVKKVFIDSLDNVFAGGKNEFGVFMPDSMGVFSYKSLSATLSPENKNFGEIVAISNCSGKIYFLTQDYVFIYNYQTIKTIKTSVFNRAFHKVNNNLYSYTRRAGVIRMKADTFKTVPGSEIFNNTGVIAIKEINNNKELYITLIDGVYIRDIAKQKFEKIENSNIAYIQSKHIFDVEQLPDNKYVFATYYGGIIFTDSDFNPIIEINEDKGLSNDVCTELFVDGNNDLWCATQNGISLIELSTPMVKFDNRMGLPKVHTSAYLSRDNKYIGSVSGLYHFNGKEYKHVEGVKNQVWYINKIQNQLYFTDYKGVFELNGNQFTSVMDFSKTSWGMVPYKQDSSIFIVGTTAGLEVLKLKNKKLTYSNYITGFDGVARWFNCDKDGNIWVSDQTKGIYKFKINDEITQITDTLLYDTSSGLPENIKNYLWKHNNNLYAGTINGIYKYNPATDKFVPMKKTNTAIGKHDVWDIKIDNRNNLWFVGNEGFGKVSNPEKNAEYEAAPFNRFDASVVINTYVKNADSILFSLPDYSMMYFPNKQSNYKSNYNVLISQVSFLNNDTSSNNMLWGGKSKIKDIPKIEYKNNSLKFRYAFPYFIESDQNTYSYRLKGFEDNFSKASKLAFRDYTNLPEGDYVFEVKAKNIYGLESAVSSFKFTILPPWYRTIYAYIMYIIGGVLLIVISIKIYTYRLKQANIKLENTVQERTAEIMQQKEEIQAQAEELEATNMELEKLSIVASETDNSVVIADKDGRIEYVNSAFTKMYGYDFDEFIQIFGDNMFKASNNPDIEKIINTGINTQKSQSYFTKAQTKQGNTIWVQTTLTPIVDEYDKIFKLVAIDSDITKIKEAEEEIRQKNKHITDSINYAQRIQNAVLPGETKINRYFDNFIFFKPRDIVSGDFYWMLEHGNDLFFAVADCTGHGVPGAFMSMIGNTLLNEIILSKECYNPAEILDELNINIVNLLKNNEDADKQSDGMDITLIKYNKASDSLSMALANHQAVVIRKTGEEKIIKGAFFSIGEPRSIKKKLKFKENKANISAGDTLYMFSDGMPDQIGGNDNKKYGSSQLIDIFKDICTKETQEQKAIIEKEFTNWKANQKQMDDVLVVGIKF